MENKVPPKDIVNFFMVGCPRCGTTWVYAALKDHPQIYLPAQKQTYFFNYHYDKGIDFYMSNFAAVEEHHLAIGEIATGYSLPHAVPRLAEHFPDVRLMIAMRNPTERAYSFYQSRAVGEGWKTFQDAVAAQPDILEQGKYADQIEHLLEHYPRERLLMLFYDDLLTDDNAYLTNILQYLEVDSSYQSPQIGRMVQVAAFPRLRKALRRMHMGPIVDFVSRTPFGDFLRKQLKERGVRRYPPIDESTKAFLTDFYRPYNERLERLAQRDLSHWNT